MTDPENWQARMKAAVGMLDEAINTGEKAPARRAMEIVNQLLAESVILDAKRCPHKSGNTCGRDGPCLSPACGG